MTGWVKVVLFTVTALGAGTYFGRPFFASRGEVKRLHLPGRTSDGHHQIEDRCDSCHTPFGGVANDACRTCHGPAMEAANDAHPESKFTDPRHAERTAHFDARACRTCHVEHVAERTSRTGVTVGADFCGNCHGDIETERPDHKGLPFATCSQTGCHNFHDNLALTEEYLAKHLNEPRLLGSPAVLARATVRGRPPAIDVPAEMDDAKARDDWSSSAHARAGVTCNKCHAADEKPWERKPGFASCRGCHKSEGNGFDLGKHGMRAAAGLAPMTVALARLPMKHDATGTLGCATCHDAHTVDTRKAATDACLGCHDDAHSRAFPRGPHVAANVTCATCHLPRASHREGEKTVVSVEHDQNANLRPVTKMIRTVCSSCHGVGYAIDALADAELVTANFDREPLRHVDTLEMVAAREEQKAKKRAEKQRAKEEGK